MGIAIRLTSEALYPLSFFMCDVNVLNNNKTFIISPQYVGKGNLVILALYDGDKFIKAYTQIYQDNDVEFTIAEDHNNAKVMLWENFETLVPICDAWKK